MNLVDGPLDLGDNSVNVKQYSGFQITYQYVLPEHPFIQSVARRLEHIRGEFPINPHRPPEEWESLEGAEAEAQKDTCKSKAIICLLRDPKGKSIIGSNGIITNQEICHRHLAEVEAKREVDYMYCKSRDGCWQPGHAETMVIYNLLVKYGILNSDNVSKIFVPGTFNNNHMIGIIDIERFLSFIQDNNIKEELELLGDPMKVILYGHEACCEECASLFNAVGINLIHVCPETHNSERRHKAKIHQGRYN